MRVILHNIGPINTADIQIRPLVVFVGPNNTGKSFAATAVHALLSRFAVDDSALQFGRGMLRLSNLDPALSESAYESFSAKQKTRFSTLTPDVSTFIHDTIVDGLRIYARSVVDELERVAGTDIKNLRRSRGGRRPRTTLRIEFERPRWIININIGARNNTVRITPPALEEIWGQMTDIHWRTARRRASRILGSGNRQSQYMLREMIRELFELCFIDTPSATYYLPAARSGLMQSHKVISGSLVRQSSLAGIRSMNIPAMSGVVTEFLSNLVEIESDNEGGFKEQAAKLEAELLHGEVIVDESSASPEVLYRTDLGSFPLSRTSSMVSEIAPIVIYLRNIVDPHEMLFIEEPEAHLHPSAQIILARIIVELVNAGLYVGLTTHSEFFLQQLSNSVLAGAISDDAAEASGYSQADQLEEKDVAVYRFEPSADGTLVTPIPASATDGIANDSFDKVTEKLYDEMVELGQAIADEA